MQTVCPACLSAVTPETRVCPCCGVIIAAYGREVDAFGFLVRALSESVAETRRGAIVALGGLGDARAARPLAELAFDWPEDVWQAVEILRSLHRLPLEETVREELLRLNVGHPSRPVRELAGHVLREMFEHGRRHPSPSARRDGPG